jgi:hypothetical protein
MRFYFFSVILAICTTFLSLPVSAMSQSALLDFFTGKNGLLPQQYAKLESREKALTKRLNQVRAQADQFSNDRRFENVRMDLETFEKERKSIQLRIQLLLRMSSYVGSRYRGEEVNLFFQEVLKTIVKREAGVAKPFQEQGQKEIRDYALTLMVLLGMRGNSDRSTLEFMRMYFNSAPILSPKTPAQILAELSYENGERFESVKPTTKEQAGDVVAEKVEQEEGYLAEAETQRTDRELNDEKLTEKEDTIDNNNNKENQEIQQRRMETIEPEEEQRAQKKINLFRISDGYQMRNGNFLRIKTRHLK